MAFDAQVSLSWLSCLCSLWVQRQFCLEEEEDAVDIHPRHDERKRQNHRGQLHVVDLQEMRREDPFRSGATHTGFLLLFQVLFSFFAWSVSHEACRRNQPEPDPAPPFFAKRREDSRTALKQLPSQHQNTVETPW